MGLGHMTNMSFCIEIASLLFLKKSFRYFPVPQEGISVSTIAVRKQINNFEPKVC